MDIVISEIAAIAPDRQREMNGEERGAGLKIDMTEIEIETETATVTVTAVRTEIEMVEAPETEIEASVGIESIVGEDIRQNLVDTNDHAPLCTMEPGLVLGHLRLEVRKRTEEIIGEM